METAPFSTAPDLLTGLNEDELQVLAEGVLSSRYQVRLNELLQRNREEGLVASEERELGRLLEHVDLLNVLKARAMYTLQQQQERKKGSQGFLGADGGRPWKRNAKKYIFIGIHYTGDFVMT